MECSAGGEPECHFNPSPRGFQLNRLDLLGPFTSFGENPCSEAFLSQFSCVAASTLFTAHTWANLLGLHSPLAGACLAQF